ncbi:MAG: LytTR family transcriptional regulator DNA-binding domain-containing protein [Lewinellaceae bacterium]|nr:LytTR family transcriptional regulator DNA-binding domain-containing protein [Phaeodactylibacter sp.]MCB9037533.1 LytTR family transcriptional regulator DNA-binding domain-containing protein [Lewinellaceae bacterium]
MKNFLQRDVPPTFSAFVVDSKPETVQQIETMLLEYFPNLDVKGSAAGHPIARRMIEDMHPDIVFFDLMLWRDFRCTQSLYWCEPDFETVILSDAEARLADSIHNAVTGYLIKPVKGETLVLTVQHALQRILERKELHQNRKFIKHIIQRRLQETPIGIPTIEGYEFLAVNEIIRCEGLQKYTRVITRGKTDIVSSYNLGEFRNLLEPYGFFAPHRCHLINLRHIKKYHREGSIYMEDGICIPVAKRMKKAFLALISRL